MKIIAAIILILSFLGGGVARLAFAFLLPQAKRASGAAPSRTGQLIIGFVNIVISTAGMICLFLEIFGPWKIIFGTAIITSLVEIIVRVRSGAKFL